MRQSLDRLCESDEPVGLVELAQQLLAIETPIDLGVARRVVGSALGRPPDSLSDPIVARDLGPNAQCAIFDLPLESADFVIVDLETTGLSAAHAVILEIGAVRVSQLQIVDHFETLVRPAGRLPRSIVALTGISDEAVADAPTSHQAL
jgi:DNA polymerase III epsilon subunit-like protein